MRTHNLPNLRTESSTTRCRTHRRRLRTSGGKLTVKGPRPLLRKGHHPASFHPAQSGTRAPTHPSNSTFHGPLRESSPALPLPKNPVRTPSSGGQEAVYPPERGTAGSSFPECRHHALCATPRRASRAPCLTPLRQRASVATRRQGARSVRRACHVQGMRACTLVCLLAGRGKGRIPAVPAVPAETATLRLVSKPKWFCAMFFDFCKAHNRGAFKGLTVNGFHSLPGVAIMARRTLHNDNPAPIWT